MSAVADFDIASSSKVSKTKRYARVFTCLPLHFRALPGNDPERLYELPMGLKNW
jgi:hypothetical protein